MARANLPLAFAELLVGALIVEAGIKGASLGDVVRGTAKQSGVTGLGSGAAGSAAGSTAGDTGASPFSADATGSRLDQGQDVTSKAFHAPGSGTIVAADQSNGGWAGGGLVGLKLDHPPDWMVKAGTDVLYFAEGLSPTVPVGQHVSQGDQIAIPAINPYNGISGNIEWGPANPRNPSQPLAQLVRSPSVLVRQFYDWALTVGAPKSSSLANAGRA